MPEITGTRVYPRTAFSLPSPVRQWPSGWDPGSSISVSERSGMFQTSAEPSALLGKGAITWDNLTWTDISQAPQSLTGTLGDGNGVIHLETVNGDIDISGVD